MDRFEDGVHVAAVVAAGSEQRQHAAPQQLPAREIHILVVDLLRQRAEAVGQVVAQVKELQLFRGFLAAAHQAQVVHDALDRGLAEVLGIAKEGKVGFRHKRGRDAQHQKQEQDRRIPHQLYRPDHRSDGHLDEATHLLDHGQPICGLDAGALEAVVEVRVFVSSQIEPCRLAHHPDAHIVGITVREQGIGIVDGPRERAGDQRKDHFGGDDPPEMSGQRLPIDGLLDPADDQRGRFADGPRHEGDQHPQN